jgi:hypothetical protein
MCIFWAEVSEKCAFFGQKCLKNVRFLQAEVSEKRVFFMWKWLKNVRFSGGTG